jgi:hypothetical protein
MQRPHLRPRFVMLAPCGPDDVRAALEARLREREERLEFRVRTGGVLAWVKAPARRFWSPSMDALLRPHPRGTLIVGRFGPNQSLMTGYFFLSILLGFLICLSATWGYVQTIMGEPPRCLIGSSLGVAGLVGIWASSKVGTAWAHDQMLWLAEVVDGMGDVIDDEAAVMAEAHGPPECPKPSA